VVFRPTVRPTAVCLGRIKGWGVVAHPRTEHVRCPFVHGNHSQATLPVGKPTASCVTRPERDPGDRDHGHHSPYPEPQAGQSHQSLEQTFIFTRVVHNMRNSTYRKLLGRLWFRRDGSIGVSSLPDIPP
jgi:hypothetical protein